MGTNENQTNANQNTQLNPDVQQNYQNNGVNPDAQQYQGQNGYNNNQQYQGQYGYNNSQQYQNQYGYSNNQQYQGQYGYNNNQQYQGQYGYGSGQQYAGSQSYLAGHEDSSSVFKDAEGYVPPEKKNFKPNFGMIAGGVLAIILIIVIVILAKGKRTVDLDDFISEPEFSGYNGMGTAYGAGIDKEEFLAKYEDIIDYSDNIDSKGSDSGVDIYYYKVWGESAAEALYDYYLSYNVKLDETSDLSNGDTVTYIYDFSEDELEEIEDYFNVKLKYDEDGVSYTVEGLEEIKSVDVFADIEITYSGTAPNGSISSVKNSRYDYIDYEYTPSSGLSNGSTVTISISDSDVEELTEKDGCIPTSTSTEVTVDGLGTYVTELSQIPDETMDKIKAQAEDVINAEIASNWSEPENLEGITFLGCTFLTPKNESDYGSISISYYDATTYLNMVYKVDVHLYDESIGLDYSFSYYTNVAFYDIMLLPDGSCSLDLSDYELQTNKYYIDAPVDGGTKSFYYYGFEDIDTMFNVCVTTNIDKYNYENTVEE